MDLVSGKLDKAIEHTITKESNTEIASLFKDLVKRRNRIIHSFQITSSGEQLLSTKDLDHKQYPITEEYLMEFIVDNDLLSGKLHDLRVANKKKIKNGYSKKDKLASTRLQIKEFIYDYRGTEQIHS